MKNIYPNNGHKIFSILFTLTLLTIATDSHAKSKQQQILDSWINRPESELIERWGLPHRQMEGKDKQKIYEYGECSQPVGMSFNFDPNYAYSPRYNISRQNCGTWTFYVKDGIIVGDKLVGN